MSEAATTRIQTSVQNSMMNFRQDLARQLGSMCLELRGDSNYSAADARILTQNYELWERTNSTFGVIANIYLWKSTQNKDGLLHLVPVQGRFETIPWPARFNRVHPLLASASSPQAADWTAPLPSERKQRARSARISGTSQSDVQVLGAVDQSVPLLILPESDEDVSDWLLVELNPKVLEQTIFPQIAQRYFGDARNSEYEVAVISEGAPGIQILYSSVGDFQRSGKITADAALNLFGPPGGPHRPALDLFRSRRGLLRSEAQTTSSVSGNDTGEIFAPVRFDPIDSDAHGSDWQVVVRHRKGSLAAAVGELRFRNLEISFGVLILLAASMGLILFNSYRARRLALLQMDFVAGVSHELRTPVAAILSISENMSDGIVENPQQMLRYGGLIRNQARQLNHLVEQVLRFAAMQGKNTAYTIRRLQVSEVIDEVLENLSNLITASGIKVDCEIEPGLPPVEADFGVLSQCLQNLISNACKYGGDSKWIGIRATMRQVIAERWINITVEDHGMGIDSAELRHIFEPFYRTPKVVASHVHGTGLGLALAKSFAEIMGGHLTVSSNVGEGSAFTLHLRAASGLEILSRNGTELRNERSAR